MSDWSIDIVRQSGWDLWVIVCAFATVVLVSYAIAGQLWQTARGVIGLVFAGVAALGTLTVLVVPMLHTQFVGIAWTFAVMVLLSITFYLNLLPQLGARRTIILLLMRIVALILVVPMLFEPVLRFTQKPRPDKPLLILVDTSASMSFPDIQNGPTRLQTVWQTLRPELGRISDHFVPQFGTFDTDFRELKNPRDLEHMEATGQATDVVTGVTKMIGRSTRADAALILISDGIDNTSPNVVAAIGREGRRVHTVLVGSDQAEPAALANVAVDNVETSDDFVVGHESKIKALIKSTALANRVVDVKLSEIDAAGKPIDATISQKLVLQPVVEGQSVELTYKPRSVGVHRLAVWIDPIPGERNLADNRQELQGLALDPRIKVLYIEGRARPEFRDLNRALARDPNIEVATLLRIQQDRFAASGSVDGDAFTRMPTTMEEWKKFDVIILGDLDSTFLNPAQQAAIEQLVSGGGGLLMLGGQNSFGPGSYAGTPVEKALPVFCGDVTAAQEKSEFVPRLTAEGAVHPAMEGLQEWFGLEDKKGTKDLPPLRGNVVVPRPKSGASVLLTHAERPGPDGKPQMILVTQRYGQGRSAAFTADTTYLWYLPLRGMGQDSPYNRFWGQLVRWLAGEDVRNRQHGAGVEGLLNKSVYQLGESVRVRAMVRDDKGDATRYAQVSLLLKQAGKKDIQMPLAPAESRTGMYEATITTPDKGEYTVELNATKDGKPLGKQTLKFSVIAPADEMLKLAANSTLMTAIAKETSGYSYKLEQFHTLIDDLIAENPGATTPTEQSVPLASVVRATMFCLGHTPAWDKKYDLPTQGALVLLLLTIEWVQRRRWQLA